MRAVVVSDGQVRVEERPAPVPGTGEVLVRVRAAGLNGADRAQIAGHYAAPAGAPPDILGLDLAGEVEATGAGVTEFAPGDRVMAIVGGGGQAELCVVCGRHLVRVPEVLDWHTAGGVMEAFITAHDALVSQGALGAGERLLVTGAAGGVGCAAVQIALASGADVVASVRRSELHDRVAALGAAVVFPTDEDRPGPYDVILELASAANLQSNIEQLAYRGRIVVVGFGSTPQATISLPQLGARRGRIHASMLRNRSLEDKALATRAFEHHVLPLIERGAIRVPAPTVYELDDAAQAHARFAAGGIFGKIVLTA